MTYSHIFSSGSQNPGSISWPHISKLLANAVNRLRIANHEDINLSPTVLLFAALVTIPCIWYFTAFEFFGVTQTYITNDICNFIVF